MAGAFSGHLLHAFNNENKTPSIITSGAMSFDARAHGTPGPSFSPLPVPYFGFTPFSEDSTTARQIATLQAKLDKKLGPEYISQRPGPGGGPKLTYAEGWKIINLANEVFGFNGWSSSIVNIGTDFLDYNEESKRFNVGVTAIVRVTLRDGAYHEDVGYGMLENGKSKAAALDKCKKEATTDALKRTLRNFGNLLGNCLYDKSYAQEVVKIKVKLDKNDLYRRPEFTEHTPDASASAHHGAPVVAGASSIKRDEPCIKVEHENRQPETPITYVPRHLRQDMAATTAQQAQAKTPTRAVVTPAQRTVVQPSIHTSTPGSDAIASPANGAPSGAAPKSNGLATPIQTPVHVQRAPASRAPSRPPVGASPLSRVHSAPERKVSFAKPMSAPIRVGSAEALDQEINDGNEEEEDAFPLSTQDGALFSTVDLDEGDLGRPIDFEEGMGGVSTDACMHEAEADIPEQLPEVQPRPQPQVRDRVGGPLSVELPSGIPLKAAVRNQAQVEFAAKSPLPTRITGHAGSSTGGPPNAASVTSSTSSARTSSPAQDIKRIQPSVTSAGGYHPPPGMKPSMQQQPQPQTHTSKPTVSTSIRALQTGQTNALKRSADAMMAASTSASSTRSPLIQGMGLAQRQQQQQQQQNVITRRPSDHENNDPKRLKR